MQPSVYPLLSRLFSCCNLTVFAQHNKHNDAVSDRTDDPLPVPGVPVAVPPVGPYLTPLTPEQPANVFCQEP